MADSPTLAPEQTTVTAPVAGDTKTAVVEAPAVPFNELKGKDRDAFLKDGTVPAKKDPDAPADSSTAPPGEQAAGIAAKKDPPASEPGKPAKKARNSEENRVEELLTDRQRERQRADRAERDADALRQRLDALEKSKSDGKPDSSTKTPPETTEQTYERLANHPDAPDPEKYTDLKKWGVAMAHFVAQQVAKEQVSSALTEHDQARGAEAEQVREMEIAVNRAADRLEAEKAKDPTLAEKVHPKFRDLLPSRAIPDGQAVGPHHYAKDLIMFESEHPLALSAFYSGSDEGIAEWQRIMQLPARQIAREIAYRDVSFRSASPPAASAPAPAAKPFTKTPEPPAQMGTKPAGVIDKEKAAEGNFDAMWRLLDEKEGVETRPASRR